MGTRLLRRLHHPVLGALALVLAAGLWAVPANAAPAQEPGVTLRVFDMQVALTELCTLKPGQTPNVDKLMPTINWTTAADFGFEDNFVTQVIGNVNIATAGSYTFRLTSDDGSRLLDRRQRRHQPRRPARRRPPKDGTVTLTTGYHALRIDHFERGGGQQLTLEWQTARLVDVRARAELGAEHRRRRRPGDRARAARSARAPATPPATACR